MRVHRLEQVNRITDMISYQHALEHGMAFERHKHERRFSVFPMLRVSVVAGGVMGAVFRTLGLGEHLGARIHCVILVTQHTLVQSA